VTLVAAHTRKRVAGRIESMVIWNGSLGCESASRTAPIAKGQRIKCSIYCANCCAPTPMRVNASRRITLSEFNEVMTRLLEALKTALARRDFRPQQQCVPSNCHDAPNIDWVSLREFLV